MGARILFRLMSNAQLQAHVRKVAQDSGKVYFADHARLRMLQRGVNDMEVIMCLREGVIQRPPDIDAKSGETRVRMEHFGSSRNLGVVVALHDQDPDLLVVTVMVKTR